MEIYEGYPKKFMAKLPRHEPVIRDHTAVIHYKKCPRKYFYRIVLGRVPKETPPYFAFGGAYHKFREVLELEYKKLTGGSVRVFDDVAGLSACQKGIEAAMQKWNKDGRDPTVGTRFDFMTGDRLLKSCLVAYKHWEKEKRTGAIIVLATEQAFNIQMPDGSATAGRADQIVRWNGRMWGRDFKTSSKDQKYYSRTLDPNDQFTRYTWAEGQLSGEQIQGQIVEVLFNDKKKGPEVYTHIATRSRAQIDRWLVEEAFWNKIMQVAREEDMYPMVEAQECSYCEYHSVCKSSSEHGAMSILENSFNFSPWDCTKVDQD